MIITNYTDKSTRMITKEKCKAELAKVREDLLIYKKEKAPKEKIDFSEAKIAVWKRILVHINNGETITINDKQEIHWLEANKIQVN
jgi:hypothetical protein